MISSTLLLAYSFYEQNILHFCSQSFYVLRERNHKFIHRMKRFSLAEGKVMSHLSRILQQFSFEHKSQTESFSRMSFDNQRRFRELLTMFALYMISKIMKFLCIIRSLLFFITFLNVAHFSEFIYIALNFILGIPSRNYQRSHSFWWQSKAH